MAVGVWLLVPLLTNNWKAFNRNRCAVYCPLGQVVDEGVGGSGEGGQIVLHGVIVAMFSESGKAWHKGAT